MNFPNLTGLRRFRASKVAVRDARREGLPYVRLAFLAPKIVEAIAERGALTDLKLTPHVDLPLEWRVQQRVVGFE